MSRFCCATVPSKVSSLPRMPPIEVLMLSILPSTSAMVAASSSSLSSKAPTASWIAAIFSSAAPKRDKAPARSAFTSSISAPNSAFKAATCASVYALAAVRFCSTVLCKAVSFSERANSSVLFWAILSNNSASLSCNADIASVLACTRAFTVASLASTSALLAAMSATAWLSFSSKRVICPCKPSSTAWSFSVTPAIFCAFSSAVPWAASAALCAVATMLLADSISPLAMLIASCKAASAESKASICPAWVATCEFRASMAAFAASIPAWSAVRASSILAFEASMAATWAAAAWMSA